MQNLYKTPVGEPEGNRAQESRCIWKDNITIDLKEMGWEGEDWIYVVQALANAVINFWFHKIEGIPSLVEKILASYGRLGSMELI
jgi:hypothetical protein